jgi:carbamoyl-phosphate synthase (ammonia)
MCGDVDLDEFAPIQASTKFVGCKAPMFSFQRLKGADPALGVEMTSTGEVACFGPNKYDAFLKAMMSTGMKIPEQNILVSIQEQLRPEAVPALTKLHQLGYTLYATEKTAEYLQIAGLPVVLLHYKDSGAKPCIDDYIFRGDIELVLMFSNQHSQRVLTNYAIRRLAVDYGVPLITNIQVAMMFADSLTVQRQAGGVAAVESLDVRSLHEWYE